MEFSGVEVKFVDIEEEHRWRRRPTGRITDAETRKRGEQTGLDTLVVHAVNDGC